MAYKILIVDDEKMMTELLSVIYGIAIMRQSQQMTAGKQ